MNNLGFINLVQKVYVTYIISALLRTGTATLNFVLTYGYISWIYSGVKFTLVLYYIK